MIALRTKIKFARGRAGRRRMVRKPPEPAVVSDRRVTRISKLLALAIRFEGLIRDGQLSDQSELARLAHVSQPRITQIMNLLHLAPDSFHRGRRRSSEPIPTKTRVSRGNRGKSPK